MIGPCVINFRLKGRVHFSTPVCILPMWFFAELIALLGVAVFAKLSARRARQGHVAAGVKSLPIKSYLPLNPLDGTSRANHE